MHQLLELRVPLPCTAAHDREDALHLVIEQAFAQDTLSDHPGRSKQNDLHSTSVARLARCVGLTVLSGDESRSSRRGDLAGLAESEDPETRPRGGALA
jgi:hypothetical protein